jgi:hypothetical protein
MPRQTLKQSKEPMNLLCWTRQVAGSGNVFGRVLDELALFLVLRFFMARNRPNEKS